MLSAIAIGSNIRPEEHVPLALTCLADAFRLVDVSRFYETDPVGPPGRPDYWNGAVLVETTVARAAVVDVLRAIEHRLGRRRSDDRFAPRPIDLDIIWWDGVCDPDVHERPFLRWCLRDMGLL